MRTTPSTAIDDARLHLADNMSPTTVRGVSRHNVGKSDNASGRGVSSRLATKPDRQAPGTYRLPHDIAARLSTALAGFKTRDRAMTLAVFLGRFWSSRARMARPFPIDRRALADHDALGLTEAQVRGALRTLEEVGFLLRAEPLGGSRYQPTPEGLHRKPILFGFGKDYGSAFAAANARAERKRGRVGGRMCPAGTIAARGAQMPSLRAIAPVPRASTLPSPPSNSPKDIDPRRGQVIMGEVARASGMMRIGEPAASSSPLDLALQRLGMAAGFTSAM